MKIIILGSVGNCIDILDTISDINDVNNDINDLDCIGFLDDDPKLWGKLKGGVKILGPLNKASEFEDVFFINGIGSTNNFWKKKEIIDKTNIPNDRFLNIIHPSASVSRMTKIGNGTVIFQNVTITSNVEIGNHVIILPGTVISHDCVIGDYTCIAGGVNLSGGIKIGSSCYLGSNCSIKENIVVGDNSLIGMGSVILNDIPKNSVYVGNPARLLRVLKE